MQALTTNHLANTTIYEARLARRLGALDEARALLDAVEGGRFPYERVGPLGDERELARSDRGALNTPCLAVADPMAFGFNAGLLVEPVEQLSIGLSIIPPMRFHGEGSAGIDFTGNPATRSPSTSTRSSTRIRTSSRRSSCPSAPDPAARRWRRAPSVLTSDGMPAIPALIVSGYLGSGKTTLVGHLLREAQAQGVRLAIISNEFGDTGIDRALLEAGDEGFVELDGGCVCCRLSDALGETLEQILTTVKPDRLVLETSGVALPGDVLVQFWRPPVDALISEEVVVVLIDAEHLLQTPELEDTFLEQVEAADLLLLNKCDLIDEAGRATATERLRALSGGQPVLYTVRSEVAPSLLFPPDPEGLRQERRDPTAKPAPHVHEQFNTRELTFEGVVTEEEVLARVAAEGAVRAKGFVRTADGLRVVQGVGARIELTDPDKPIRDELIGKVVIIHRAADAS